ncbi:MAG: TIR domain-containing protein, partial [Bacteroidales bacterium]|nr:TIR domain-containing protein [Bacteroidales bacterium]
MDTNKPNSNKKAPINNGRPVYISYAGNSDAKPEWEHIADGVEELKKALEEANIEYRIREETSNDKVTEFEREIGDSEIVVLIFSDLYFRTEHCMHEFVEIKKSLQKNPDKKIFCIKNGTFDLADVNYILEIEHFWGDERQEYGEIEFHQMRQHSEQEEVAKGNDFYIDDVRHLYSFFSAMNYLNMAVIDWKA